MTAADLHYPPELPVSAHRDEILAALRAHDVVIVSGDTGSGKTTQLPKMALELGLGVRGRRIAVTQPRRLAAVTMAERVAAELGGAVGETVGYQHRFGKSLSPQTRVKFMTDGVLLAETRTDPLLRAYDAIIVDEAHERSLNVDFLLGILRRILQKRYDLKVIVASATMDTARFSAFFFDAPCVAVPGRLFPVEIRYQPPFGDDPDLARDVADAVTTLPPNDDILVFLPGERDIRECADELEHRFGAANDVIPLIATLPAAEQRRAFRPSPRRRIILATNVAETSVTIPGIRAVIDSGLARLSRYVHRTQVQRLQIEPISQASARQRAGRCGRLGPGTCIRLYAEEDFAAREAYTPPEVLRASLAGVILTMLDLRLGDIAEFPFIDAPKPAMIHEGFRELLELGAVTRDADREPSLTDLGRTLARMPLEPRLARMLVAAARGAVLSGTLPVVAALSCDDPRRRPIDEREKADQAHAAFRQPGSDFLGTLKLWQWWENATNGLSQAKARALAKKTYLSYPKMREWRDLVRQLADLCQRLGLSDGSHPAKPDPADEEFAVRFHRALLAGLLNRIGRYDEEAHDYRGAHGTRFALHPGSILAKKPRKPAQRRPDGRPLPPSEREKQPGPPPWVVAGELVDTARLFARHAAEIDPAWLEEIAGDLCRRSYRAPEWDAQSGFARVTEQVTLYGLVIIPSRRRDLSHIDPPLAREIFIRDGLLAGAFPRPFPPVRETLEVLADLRAHAERLRRPDLFDEARLYAHFDAALPADVASADALRRWVRRAAPADVAKLVLRREDWLRTAEALDQRFPDRIRLGGTMLDLDYRHTPDDDATDGITCTVRRADLGALKLWQSDFLVPGALPEKIAWLLSVLPANVRRALPPRDECIADLAEALRPGSESLTDALRRIVRERWRAEIPAHVWARAEMPAHLRVRFLVLDDDSDRVLLDTRDRAAALALAGKKPASNAPQTAVQKAVTWSFGTLADRVQSEHGGWTVERYPALLDEETGVTLRLYPDRATAERIHARGVTRLLYLALASDLRRPLRSGDVPLDAALYLGQLNYARELLADDIFFGSVQTALVDGREAVRSEAAFVRRADERDAVLAMQGEVRRLVLAALDETARLLNRTEQDARLSAETSAAVTTHLAWLVFRGFPAHVPPTRLRQYARYLKGVSVRLDRARNSPSSDRAKAARVDPYWQRYTAALAAPKGPNFNAEALDAYRWLLEEYRISVFAQEIRTLEPVSPARLDALWAQTGL